MHLAIRAVLIGTFSCVCAAAAAAQRVSGEIRDSTTSVALSGVVISVMDSANRPLTRFVSDGGGHFSVEMPKGATHLRVVRIGFRPRTIPIDAASASGVTNVAMLRISTLLSAVEVTDDRTCSSSGDRTAALSLWEQARAGLLAAVVAREALPARAVVFRYERTESLDPATVLRQASRSIAGLTTRPFQSGDTPAVLAERGYLVQDGESHRYLAPDADVLLDESFAATHCFSVRTADSEHAGMLGLAFEPARGRDTLVDVRGTLWLESGVPALRVLEFGYVGAGASLERAGARGIIHFQTMSNGVVFVDDWHVTIPVIGQTSATASNRARVSREDVFMPSQRAPRVVQMSETGGVVLNATWPDSVRWTSPLKALAGVVTERGSSAPLDGVLLTLDGTGDTVATDSAGRFAFYPVLPGRYALRMIDTMLSAFVAPRSAERALDLAADGTTPLRLELPSRARAMRSVCPEAGGATTSLLVGRLLDRVGSAHPPRDVQVSTTWAQAGGASLASGFKRMEQAVDVDAAGRFAFCGAPREHALRITASRYGQRFADTVITIGVAADVQTLDWRLDVAGLARVERIPPARFTGRVAVDGGGAALANAEVWFPMLDRRARTDSSGAFAVDSLPAGPTLVQVRRIGYAARRDTVTFVAGGVVTRTYALASQAAMLDTVRTVADGVKYTSPALRGFEERRANAVSGHFIPESELRKHDDAALSSIIMSRVSGLQLTPGRMGAAYLSSSRKPCQGSALTKCSPPNCFVTTYIDGVLAYIATDGNTAPAVDFSRIEVSELAGVEFYPGAGAGPSQFNATGSGCGVLLLWTREHQAGSSPS